jgi:hypothetical protein
MPFGCLNYCSQAAWKTDRGARRGAGGRGRSRGRDPDRTHSLARVIGAGGRCSCAKFEEPTKSMYEQLDHTPSGAQEKAWTAM